MTAHNRVFLAALSLSLLLAIAPTQAQKVASSEDPVANIEPITDSDFYENGQFSEAKVELGRLLFFDKLLSGNKNIACATCHHPKHGTSDGLPLGFGEGGVGLGPERRIPADAPVLARVPRNAPSLYLIGAKEFDKLFLDGRVEKDHHGNWESGFWTPAREQFPPGLDNILAVQAMFPVTSPVEMAGHKGENPIANRVSNDILAGPDGAWALLGKRLQEVPGYVERFKAAFPHIKKASDISYVDAANAIAAFQAAAFRSDDSPFDRYLRTRDRSHLDDAAWRGMKLFYGRAGCSDCHSGKFQTDQDFHAIAMPQIGPGRGAGWDYTYFQATGFNDRIEDLGRYSTTYQLADKYSFRTPSLRNVEITGPWGHAGTFDTLESAVRHHINPIASLESFDANQVPLPPLEHIVERTAVRSKLNFRPVNPRRLADWLKRESWVQKTPSLRGAIAAANEFGGVELSDEEVADLIAFLRALTDPRSRDQSDLIPDRVPSGLPVPD
ncbi:MAG: hypothetical protein Tsb0020_01710 [Haliangiales bacterium]